MKTIFMLLQSEFPPDIRLEKEIKSLYENGFNVILLCNNFSKKEKKDFKYCQTIRLKAPFNSVKLNRVINYPLFFNPRFIYYSLRIFFKNRIDFIHVHDLPLFPIALFLKILFRKKLVLDMHENYPAALRAFNKKGIFNYIFKNPSVAKKLEKFAVRKADKIICVIEENKERIVKNYKIESQKVVIVSNTVDLDNFGISPIKQDIINKYKDKFVILYAGWISPERGLETPILAMEYLNKKLPEAHLLLVGNGISVPYLKGLVDSKKINNVEFVEWVGHENINSYMKASKIGIVTHPVEEFINTTITHKLFEYMSQGLTVLVSNSKPFLRIISETNAGLVFESTNPRDFAEKVIQIKNSSIEFGKNGYDAVQKKYNWKNDAQSLVKLYENLKN